MRPASYNRCATPIVRDTLKLNLREASCCRVDVVNGAAGFLVAGLVSMDDTTWSAWVHASRKDWASASDEKVLPHVAFTTALPVSKCPTTRNVDLAVWASISRSRSTTMRTPTLCTRPALREGRIFRHNTGLNSNPTKRSKIRRACCAFTRSASTVRGDSMAFKMAGLVISENTIRLVCSGWSPRASTKCQLMASPSRSSSVASHTVSAFLARDLSSVTTFLEEGLTSYLGAKSLSMSTLSLPLARSRM